MALGCCITSTVYAATPPTSLTEASTEASTEVSEETTETTTESSDTENSRLKEIRVLNNQFSNYDFKSQYSQEALEHLAGDRKYVLDLGEQNQNLQGLSQELSWLISNNIISRNVQLSANDCNFVSTDYTKPITKTELYTALYKSYDGVLESRPYLFKNTDDSVWVLSSANVYELYLKKCLDKGLISEADLSTEAGKNFIEAYKALSTNGSKANIVWDNTLQATDDVTVFGASHDLSAGKLVDKIPAYFGKEDMLTYEALNVIAEYLRVSEKDMSNLESSIISYKYGVSYVANVDEETAKNIEFLIAKGVLDYDDPNFLSRLFCQFSYEDAYKILYRVANTDARLNFSEVQLTDNDNFWKSEGFYADRLSITEATVLPEVKTITAEYWDELLRNDTQTSKPEKEEENGNSHNTFINDILGYNESWLMIAHAAEMQTFTVIKMFDTQYDYQYKDIAISELSTSENKPEEFVSYEEHTFGSGDDTSNMAKVTFRVQAKDYATAVLMIDNNITIENNLKSTDSKSYTTISSNGEEITLIPATTLQTSMSDISIVEDKVLMNNVTGVTAVFLPEAGYALVGNRVIRSDKLIVTDTSDQIYYNLEVLCYLLGNTYLSSLTDKELFVCNALQNEMTVPVYGSNENELCKTYVVDVGQGDSAAKYYNVDNVDQGINCLTRKFRVNESDVYLKVEWEYVVPDVEALSQFLDNNFLGQGNTHIGNNRQTETSYLTLKDVNETIYTRPSDTELQEWWDSNISVSNSLANFMYGTAGVEYVKSGYLVPSLTILRKNSVSDNAISTLFTSNGFTLDSIGLQYCGSTTNWWQTYYSAETMQNSSMKALAQNSRKCEILNYQDSASGSSAENYFITKAAVLYQAVDSNDLLEYRQDKIFLKTRVSESSVEIAAGTTFTYNGNEWLYQGTRTINGASYYVVQPNFTISQFCHRTIYNTEEYGILPYYSNGHLNLDNSASVQMLFANAKTNVNSLYQTYFNTTAPIGVYNTGTDLFGCTKDDVAQFFTVSIETNAWYVNDSKLIDKRGTEVTPALNTVFNKYQQKDVNFVPKLYIPTGNWFFYGTAGNYSIMNGPLATSLGMNHVFTTGIMQSVKDSIIYKYTNTVPVKDLVNEQVILINDVRYKVTTGKNGEKVLVSEPIRNSGLVQSLKTTSDETETLNAIKRYLFTGIRVNCGGTDYYLSSFIKSGTVGDLNNPNSTSGVLYEKSGKRYVYVDAGAVMQSPDTQSPQSVCVSIILEDGLYARPTTSKMNTFVLLMVSSITPNTEVDNIPFYSESLSYASDTVTSVSLETSTYYVSQLFKEVKQGYKKMMRQAFAGDVITVIWMFVFYLSVYLAIISWIMYFILTKGYTRKFFEVLTVPTGNNGYLRKGFDLIKILTFGIYNIDMEPTVGRTVVTSFVSFFVSYAIVFWQPF